MQKVRKRERKEIFFRKERVEVESDFVSFSVVAVSKKKLFPSPFRFFDSLFYTKEEETSLENEPRGKEQK